MSDRSKSKDKLKLFADIAMRGLIASAFFVAGATKLSFLLLHYALSDSIGAWQLVSFFLGLIEIVASFFLMAPKFVASAALLLFGVSFGAVVAVAMLSDSASVPIGDVLGLCGVVIWVSILNIGHEPFVFKS
jgi:hypothetical protein